MTSGELSWIAVNKMYSLKSVASFRELLVFHAYIHNAIINIRIIIMIHVPSSKCVIGFNGVQKSLTLTSVCTLHRYVFSAKCWIVLIFFSCKYRNSVMTICIYMCVWNVYVVLNHEIDSSGFKIVFDNKKRQGTKWKVFTTTLNYLTRSMSSASYSIILMVNPLEMCTAVLFVFVCLFCQTNCSQPCRHSFNKFTSKCCISTHMEFLQCRTKPTYRVCIPK